MADAPEASAEIIGAPELHVRAGSSLQLICTILDSTEQPLFVFWYHEQRMINHDAGVSVSVDKNRSVLKLQEADTSNSGNYTCDPANAIPAYINVHVLNATEEENPAAMLDVSSSAVPPGIFTIFMVILTVDISFLLRS